MRRGIGSGRSSKHVDAAGEVTGAGAKVDIIQAIGSGDGSKIGQALVENGVWIAAEKAAAMGNSDACWDLAVCLEEGEGVAPCPDRAYQFYLKAFLLGDKSAASELGRMHYYGIGTDPSKELGWIWWNYNDAMSESAK